MQAQTIIKKEVQPKNDKLLIITAEFNNFNLSDFETKELLIEAVAELVSDLGLNIEIKAGQ